MSGHVKLYPVVHYPFMSLVSFLDAPLAGFTLVFRGLEVVASVAAPGWSSGSPELFVTLVSCVTKPEKKAVETASFKMVLAGETVS